MDISEKQMNSRKERKRALVAEEAADWFVAHREDLDDVQRDTFTAWLKESSVHVEEYLAVMQLNDDLRKAAAGSELSIDALFERARAEEDPRVQPIRPQARYVPVAVSRRGWLYTAAAAALAVMGLAFLWLSAPRQTPLSAQATAEHFSTLHGQQLVQQLADGSLLHLDTDTSVAVLLEHDRRLVYIERGQVVFEVAHDPKRPFSVTAGSAEVIAVGTQFDVYLQGDSTLITVVEGRVTVGAAATLGGPGTSNIARKPIPVAAGQQVRVVQGQLPASPSTVDTHRATAWLHRQIAFEQEPLSVVAAEFNRYTTTPIEIETPALRGLAISGVFAVDDTESFVAFLRSLDGVRVEVTATHIRVFKS